VAAECKLRRDAMLPLITLVSPTWPLCTQFCNPYVTDCKNYVSCAKA